MSGVRLFLTRAVWFTRGFYQSCEWWNELCATKIHVNKINKKQRKNAAAWKLGRIIRKTITRWIFTYAFSREVVASESSGSKTILTTGRINSEVAVRTVTTLIVPSAPRWSLVILAKGHLFKGVIVPQSKKRSVHRPRVDVNRRSALKK